MLESEPVADRPTSRIPWFLVVASIVLLVLVLYVLFVGYLPSKQRVAGLEAELKDLYKREADLQTRIAQQDQRFAVRHATGQPAGVVRTVDPSAVLGATLDHVVDG